MTNRRIEPAEAVSLGLALRQVAQEKLLEEHLLGRFGRPSEIAAAAAFLASEDASFITGHALVVDGGFTAGLRVGLLEQLGM